MNDITDQEERIRALDPETSFIVQAPAGSGKTGLLIQRYLELLCRVDFPEEILAITFTRKAAAEMRNRVLEALAGAASDQRPKQDYQAATWERARKAASRDKARGWGICHDPARMRIMTIDSFCAGLTRQMPVLSGFGAPGQVCEEPSELYARAARNAVAELEGQKDYSVAMETLVRHLDNQLSTVESLVALMLPRREQWLRHVAGTQDPDALREMLEAAMQRVITEALEKLHARFPLACIADTADLCRFAAENLKHAAPDSLICAAENLSGLPGTRTLDLSAWQAVAELLLTKKGQWRRAVNKSIGFPAPSSVRDAGQKHLLEEKKIRFQQLTAALDEDRDLAPSLDGVRGLPAPGYTEGQWELLRALFVVLKLAAAHLEAVFQESGKVDFAEISIRARAALGNFQDPTDLALSLDYGISHILIDEFQDTSISQFDLMRQLTAGWTAGEGRTFFAVGDPMQSIYGFREAEVGLFLTAWEHGIDAHLPLEPLLLKTNFRSEPAIVEWVNSAFFRVLPDRADPDTGAVPYMPANAAYGKQDLQAVQVHARIFSREQKEGHDLQEALDVAQCAGQALDFNPDETVGILVRSRSHLRAIVPCLRQSGLRFSAVEIDSLSDRPVIRDLLSLTRALNHPGDRIAWLAVLRAPWCGLTLKDLHVLAGSDHQSPVCRLIHEQQRVDAMSIDGGMRLLRVSPVLAAAMERRGRQSLRRRVEGAWLALGGPASAANPEHLADVPVYLDYVDARAGAGLVADMEAFEQGVADLFAQPDAGADSRLQIMTIHKAKGLEFDTVILPGLHKAPRSQDPALLLWQERAGGLAGKSLLMAPVSETGADREITYNYIRQLHQVRLDYEIGRLLYVAATRAAKRLHIFGAAAMSSEGVLLQPNSRSLLAVLWPAVCAEFEKAAESGPPDRGEPIKEDESGTKQCLIRRLPPDWEPPEPQADISVKPPEKDADFEIQGEKDSFQPRFDWAGVTLRHVGSVVHRWLRRICEQKPDNWDSDRIEAFKSLFRRDLVCAGVAETELENAVLLTTTALANTVVHETGRWILSPHLQGACELKVSGFLDRELVHGVIDRTFVDADNVRWVIDYKTSTHAGGGLEAFLEREQQRYSLQMARYARLMRQLDGRRVRLGLYFPMIGAWRQWEG